MTGEHAIKPEEFRLTLGLVIQLCGAVGWKDLGRQAARLLRRAEAGERGEAMMKLAEDLKEAFEEKISESQIVLVEERDTDLFLNAAHYLCAGSLHGDLAVSEEEFNLAGKALAVGLSTAAVSHAMRSVEASLHGLCRVVGITFPGTVELQDWKNLTDRLKSEIAKVEQQTRSPQKSEQLKLWSELMIPADGFRLAWRNHVAHAREKYEADEARKIIGHVGDFLKRLSTAL